MQACWPGVCCWRSASASAQIATASSPLLAHLQSPRPRPPCCSDRYPLGPSALSSLQVACHASLCMVTYRYVLGEVCLSVEPAAAMWSGTLASCSPPTLKIVRDPLLPGLRSLHQYLLLLCAALQHERRRQLHGRWQPPSQPDGGADGAHGQREDECDPVFAVPEIPPGLYPQ